MRSMEFVLTVVTVRCATPSVGPSISQKQPIGRGSMLIRPASPDIV